MLTVADVSLRFSDRKLLMIQHQPIEGNTYGLIKQWCWKINFLKISAGILNQQLVIFICVFSVLSQNHFDYEDERAIDVVIMGK